MNGTPPMVMHAGRLVSSEYRSAKDTKAGAGLPSRTTEGGRQHSMARGLPPFLPPSLRRSKGPEVSLPRSRARSILAAYSQQPVRPQPLPQRPRHTRLLSVGLWACSGPESRASAARMPERERGAAVAAWLPGCLPTVADLIT